MRNNYIVCFFCCLGFLMFSCGKESKPVPQDQKNMFTWKHAEASFINNDCLKIIVTMMGATQNIRSFFIELDPVQQYTSIVPSELEEKDYCEDCPFMPKEVAKITPEQTIKKEKSNETKYIFTYCPKSNVPIYKWRLVIHNLFTSFPYVLTAVSTVIR